MTARVPTRGVFFDVDFTLIYPGPRFQASGYHEFCARHGIDVDPAEPFAANVLRLGDTILCQSSYDRTNARLEATGLQVETLDLQPTKVVCVLGTNPDRG